MNSKTLGHLALFSVASIYAANYLIAKVVMPDLIKPSGFIFARVTGTLCLFFPILLLSGFERIKREHVLRIILCGLFGVAINQLLFFEGLSLTSPLNSALIMTSTPIIVLITSAILLKSKITPRKISGVILGAIGAMILIYLSSGGHQKSSLIGDLFILINACSYSIYLVIVKPLMAHYKPITVITWVFFVGWFVVAPFGLGEFQEVDWSVFNGRAVFSIAFVVLVATFSVYLLNIFAIKQLPPTTVSVYIYLQPFLVIFFTFLFFYLGLEDYTADLTWQKMICGVLIFIGVYLVSFEKKNAAKQIS